MSLATDTIFIAALQSNSELLTTLGATEIAPPRLWGTAAPMPDEDFENVPVPYVIVTFDGLTNDGLTKDSSYEGDSDRVNIGIQVTGRSLKDLPELAQVVRDTILNYMQANDTGIMDYQMTADAINYDSFKPCYFTTLRYQCDVLRDLPEDNEQES